MDQTGGLVLFVHHFLPHNNVYLSGASGELDLWCKMTVIIRKFSDDPGDNLKVPCHREGI